jgi:hypothetical protein
MKLKLIVLLCWLTALTTTGADGKVWISTSFHEPATDGLRFIYSRDGWHWDSIPGVWLRPDVGKQRVMRDPSIIRTPDGMYHLVWTSSWKGDRGFGYACSKDLIHWSKQRFIEVMDDTTTVNVWAPELFWDEDRRQAMIVWASCVPSRNFDVGIEDPLNNHRLYYVTTRDFKTFSKTKLLYDPGYSSIDATLVRRAKNDYVMVVKDNTRPNRNIKVCFARNPEGPWGPTGEPFTGQMMEGPTTVWVDDGWLIYYDRYRLYDFGAHFTRDFKTFEDVSDRVSVPRLHKHGTIFQSDEQTLQGLLAPRELIHYTGTTLADPNRHDGGLSPVVGVHNIQVMRANREHPWAMSNDDWTYNHQPMMAWWQGRFYLHYLCDPADEHVPPSRTMLQTSADGYRWTSPVVLFPELQVPEGFSKPGRTERAHDLKAIMHQRVGWYVSKSGQLWALGNYGVAFDRKDDPNDGNGLGRVIREVKADGTFGPIYFIYRNYRYYSYYRNDRENKGSKPAFPFYTEADKATRKACEEILANPRYRMQWVEEADRGEPLVPLNKEYKAYCDYTLPNGHVAALWKHALTSVSADGGLTWSQPVERAKGFVNSNAKIWGQRLADGTYATVYNPSEYRWPLAISLSADGLNYTTLGLVCGEVPPLRYGGNYKNRGPQYVRGIQEGNGTPPDSNLWVSYSMNKEDMWVARVPVPVQTDAHSHARGDEFNVGELSALTTWNLYSPLMAPVTLKDGWLTLSDSDPFDYARVERKIPATRELKVAFDLRAGQNDHGMLQIEFLDSRGIACSRIELTTEGVMRCKGGARYGNLTKYLPDSVYHVEAVLSVSRRMIEVYVNGKKAGQRMFFAPVKAIERVMLRTGSERRFPDVDTDADWYGTLEHAGDTDPVATFAVSNFTTSAFEGDAAFLKADDYRHYVDYFNTMEDENIVQAIPNAQAWEWMQLNVPLFDCPQKQFEQMWYYRWWTLRKHIEKTPVGYAMTEFLVNRNYADKWKLIASAVGHHIHESRWLRDTTYLDQIVNTWLHGNNGGPMEKLNKYSSWIAHSLWGRYEVDGRSRWLTSMLPSLEDEYNYWYTTHRRENGLYWQEDVRDAMEETISGGRRKKYMRPSINSYMYGNARAVARTAELAGQKDKAARYHAQADSLRQLTLKWLWNERHQFFETHRMDSSANVREAIGYMPWYTGMVTNEPQYAKAWLQAGDPEGFSAPYGQTTAERRHPEFRSHGVGQCEWDGAVWPFATSQTLTAMANYLNSTDTPVITDSLYFAELEKYVQCQSMRGKPYIGEYLDETTGYWLKGDQERSRYYNHSTFCDLMITGLCGLRPRADDTLEVHPLLPEGKWAYFCLDNVLYHGHTLTIVYDRDGSRYHAGAGLRVYVDGQLAAKRDDLGRVIIKNAL